MNDNNAKTMYETVPAAAELNKVPGFDPLKFLRRTKDTLKLDLPYQKLWFRMERRESFIMFLRRTEEPEDPYYTLEIEPDGTVRQKRTLFDRQHEDIEQATEFLLKWQKVIAARLTGSDLKRSCGRGTGTGRLLHKMG